MTGLDNSGKKSLKAVKKREIMIYLMGRYEIGSRQAWASTSPFSRGSDASGIWVEGEFVGIAESLSGWSRNILQRDLVRGQVSDDTLELAVLLAQLLELPGLGGLHPP